MSPRSSIGIIYNSRVTSHDRPAIIDHFDKRAGPGRTDGRDEEMTKCSVLGCANDWKKTSGISFHKFPKKKELRKIWLRRLRLPKNFFPSQSSVICSDHFEEKDIESTMTRICLVPDAVPIDCKDDRESENSLNSTSSEGEDIIKELAHSKEKGAKINEANPTCIFVGNQKDQPAEQNSTKNSSYLLVTVPCGKSLKDETPLKRKLRLEIIYNREIVQIKSRIIKNLYKQNTKLRERIAKIKCILKEIEKKQFNDGGICFAE